MNRNHLEPCGHSYWEMFIGCPFIRTTGLSKMDSECTLGRVPTCQGTGDDRVDNDNHHWAGTYRCQACIFSFILYSLLNNEMLSGQLMVKETEVKTHKWFARGCTTASVLVSEARTWVQCPRALGVEAASSPPVHLGVNVDTGPGWRGDRSQHNHFSSWPCCERG